MSNPNPIADHNRFYATEDRRAQSKEYFKFLASLAGPLLIPGATVLDIGCATGEFFHYLSSIYSGLHMTGMDTDEEFLRIARKLNQEATFLRGDIQPGQGLPTRKFDVVFMAGVNYLFADPEPWLKNIRELTRGKAYVFGVFNPEELDVRMLVSRPGSVEVQALESDLAENHRLVPGKYSSPLHPWELPIANPRVYGDPLRSWTVPSGDSHLVINGMQIVHRFAVLEIDPHGLYEA